jgi:dihydropyrimidinase
VLDTLIVGGTIVSEGSSFTASLGIEAQRVVGVWLKGAPTHATNIVDASGKLVLPGAIDAHFHTRTGAAYYATRADDLESATASAALGGATTVFAYVWGDPGESIGLYLDRFFDLAASKSVCDFSAHCGLPPDMTVIAQIPEAFDRGISSFKMQYAYRRTGRMADDDHRLAAMEAIGAMGGIALFHCENGYVIDYLEQRLTRAGRTKSRDYLASRPNMAEEDTVSRSISLGGLTDCAVYIVHVSSREAVRLVEEARAAGRPVFAETCPQYLTLLDSDLEQLGYRGKVAPPLRSRADQEALWTAVRTGAVEIIASDHAAYTREQKLAAGEDFFQVPPGMSIAELMLPLMFSEGVLCGRLTIETLVKRMSEAPARRFGLFPQKGTLRPGADADIVIFDPAEDWTVDSSQLLNPSGDSAYDGRLLHGRVWRSWLRGAPLVVDGRIVARPGTGRSVPRNVPSS